MPAALAVFIRGRETLFKTEPLHQTEFEVPLNKLSIFVKFLKGYKM
jgi:hypothetical protein